MKLKHAIGVLTLAALSSAAGAVTTVTLPLDNTWTEFEFAGVGSPFVDLMGDEVVFTVASSKPLYVRVVDLGFAGDSFSITVEPHGGGADLVVLTSVPVAGMTTEFDPEIAYTLADYSKAGFSLPAGSYKLYGWAVSSPDGGGIAAIAVVPEPETYALLLAGLGLVATAARRARA